MTEVTTAELRTHLSEILNRVAYGNEQVTVTRHGKSLVVISPPMQRYLAEKLATRKPVDPQLVHEAMGKYAYVRVTSEDVARAKQEEIDLEG
jgi:prevent-host-death family protein